MGNITLSEPLHLIIQGEGELIGKKMLLMRVLGCPIQCENCDSYHTWDKTRLTDYQKEYSVEVLAKEISIILHDKQIEYLMITGGEPQLYRNEIVELFKILRVEHSNLKLEIETTGLVSWPQQLTHNSYVHFDLSPKIGSLVPKLKSQRWKIFDEFINWYNVKVVVSPERLDQDLQAIQEFQKQYNIPNDKIYLMPFGTTREEIIFTSPLIIEKAFEYKYNFSSRMHILLFDSKRLV